MLCSYETPSELQEHIRVFDKYKIKCGLFAKFSNILHKRAAESALQEIQTPESPMSNPPETSPQELLLQSSDLPELDGVDWNQLLNFLPPSL